MCCQLSLCLARLAPMAVAVPVLSAVDSVPFADLPAAPTCCNVGGCSRICVSSSKALEPRYCQDVCVVLERFDAATVVDCGMLPICLCRDIVLTVADVTRWLGCHCSRSSSMCQCTFASVRRGRPSHSATKCGSRDCWCWHLTCHVKALFV